MRWLAAIVVLCLPLQTSAEVLHYNICTLREGKTLADVRAWVAEWKVLIARNKQEYAMRVLLPHADSAAKLNQFFLEGSSPTLSTYAKGWEWWYASTEAQALNAKLLEAAACDSGAIYTTD